MRRVIAILVLLVLGAGVISVQQHAALSGDSVKIQSNESFMAAEISDSIQIFNNDGFATLGFQGSGTEIDPYRIEDLQFQMNSSSGWRGIQVTNTDAHFVIQDCSFVGYIENPLSDPYVNGMGIEFENVSNSRVHRNTFSLFAWGIMMMGGSDVTINDNIFNGTSFPAVGHTDYPYDRFGIGIDINWNQLNCTNILVEKNVISNCSTGIFLSQANNSIVRENTVIDCSEGITSHRFTSFNLITRNNCSYCTSNGIGVVTTWNTTVSNNTCNYNRYYGIWLDEESFNNTIIYNIAGENGNETVWPQMYMHGNLAQEPNPGYGIWVNTESCDNLVVWNDMISNLQNAKNDGPRNSYEFNYWSDYNGADEDGDGFGEDVYAIMGDTPTHDPSPRVVTLPELSAVSMATTSTTSTTGTTSSTTETTTPPPPDLPLNGILLIGVSATAVIIVIVLVVKVRR